MSKKMAVLVNKVCHLSKHHRRSVRRTGVNKLIEQESFRNGLAQFLHHLTDNKHHLNILK